MQYNKRFRILVYSFAVFWAVMTLFPIVLTIFSSLKTNEEIYGRMFMPPSKFMISNYVEAFTGANMGRAILNSLFIAAITSIMVVIISIMASYIIARRNYFFIEPMFMLFILAIMIPVHTTLISISKLASSVGGLDKYWFLILVYVTFQLPQAIFLMTGYIKTISTEIDEAAIIDGCSTVNLIFKIILPISAPIIATISIVTFMFAYSELVFSIILLTTREKYPISRALMYFTGDKVVRLGPVFASIMLAVIPMLIIYICLHEKIQKGMTEGSVKG